MARLAQEVAEPLAGDVAHVPGVDLVRPHPHAQGALDLVDAQMQRQHARARSTTSLVRICGRTSAMRGHSRCVRNRPCASTTIQLAVQVQPGLGQQRLAQLHARAGLDGVDKQARHAGADIGSGCCMMRNGAGKAAIVRATATGPARYHGRP
jgi:hypothetical protein